MKICSGDAAIWHLPCSSCKFCQTMETAKLASIVAAAVTITHLHIQTYKAYIFLPFRAIPCIVNTLKKRHLHMHGINTHLEDQVLTITHTHTGCFSPGYDADLGIPELLLRHANNCRLNIVSISMHKKYIYTGKPGQSSDSAIWK
uniref:Uncharacterized protein n=1 Tax=Sphaerodactylus townsendi TaxID=933632 RepID=A0ACB8FP12_9SAUR